MTTSTNSGPLMAFPWGELEGRRVLLTGGTGFIGCNLLESYTKAWDRYRLNGTVSVLTRDPGAFRRRAPQLADHPGVEILTGNLRDGVFKTAHWDLVIHAAVEYGEPLDILERNFRATQVVLALAARCGAHRVLFTSSGAIYGTQPPDHEHLEEIYQGAPPLAVASAYGTSKRSSELLGLLHGERHGYDFLIARCFAFLGPWLPLEGSGAAGNFIGDAIAGRAIQINGDGRPCRSYLYGEDLANWLWTILLRGVHGRPYNVGSGEGISILDLARRVRDVVAPGLEIRIAHEPGPGLPPRYVPSVERAHQELGLLPGVNLNEAIMRTVQWNRERLRSVRGLS